MTLATRIFNKALWNPEVLSANITRDLGFHLQAASMALGRCPSYWYVPSGSD